MQKLFQLIMLFFLTGFCTAQVQVKLTQPPPNQLRSADIWKLTLTNLGKTTIQVTLIGTLEESDAGIIVEGNSKPINLPQGTKKITYDDIKTGNVNFKSGKWKDAFTRTGNAPSGDYKICIYVKNESGDEIGSDCISQKVEIASPPTLITPADEETISGEQQLSFTWLPPIPAPSGQIFYKIKIVEISGNQSPEIALQRNSAWFEKSDIRTTMFQYPVSAKKFVAGKKYAWIIYSGELKSEIFSFNKSSASCGTIKDSIIVQCMGWNDNTGLPNYSVTILLTNIPTSAALACNAIYTSITTIPVSFGTITNYIPVSPWTITPNNTVSIQFIYSPPNLTTTSVTFKATGNWQDALTNSANLSIVYDSLRSCVCNDCSKLRVSFNNSQVTQQGNNGDQYNIAGSISVNVPIYGLEFQLQSYNYTANPPSCSNGVTNIEQSGMFLIPATTINGSTSIQIFNETVSGSSNSNNNASKTVKYISSSPMNGNIPFNLTVGLPGSLTGLDADCCKISYKVCIKVTVFYDRTSCKSCTFTNCFEFNNK